MKKQTVNCALKLSPIQPHFGHSFENMQGQTAAGETESDSRPFLVRQTDCNQQIKFFHVEFLVGPEIIRSCKSRLVLCL